jgi:hypothetical protein
LKDGKFVAELLGRGAITNGGDMDSAHNYSGKARCGNGVSRPLAGALGGDATGTAPALDALLLHLAADSYDKSPAL